MEYNSLNPPSRHRRLRVTLQGTVQGVGFRPFVYRLARELGLTGWVANASEGVVMEVEGTPAQTGRLLERIRDEQPKAASIIEINTLDLPPVGSQGFEIRPSLTAGSMRTALLPDLALCARCRDELFDRSNRRCRYPFISCTACGPRYTLIEALPYDRANTTMRHFPLCEACEREYEDPGDRRFHHQANTCPDCGPQLALWDGAGNTLATRDEALLAATEALRQGRIVAVKGLGGFHLFVDARNAEAVQHLRLKKDRKCKPFALMYPSLKAVETHCEVSAIEAYLLRSPPAPIVLLRRRFARRDAFPGVAPETPYLGVMLPYTPLHHLLLAELGFPVVATSGNRRAEPLCIEEHEALARLESIADLFLVHNRPIARPVDDSVVRVALGRELMLRRARGYAPQPLRVTRPLPCVLALGGHLKNTVALAKGREVFVSHHLGDLDTEGACAAMERTAEEYMRLYGIDPELVACDLHPHYYSSQVARRLNRHLSAIQHHHAHALACMTENGVEAEPALAVVWDGTGLGPDGTLWGGEFLSVDEARYTRAAHLRYFPLPGGEQAIKEPRRAALGLLHERYGEAALALGPLPTLTAFSRMELNVLTRMIAQGLNTPRTSSVGRLFDAVSSLTGLCQRSDFEGQAAMAVEAAAQQCISDEHYPLRLDDQQTPYILDWGPLITAILDDIHAGGTAPSIAARFHNTLIEMILAVVRRAGLERVVLAGGCFQNAHLLEGAVTRLRKAGFRPYWPWQIPPNDGGLALGQAVAAARLYSGARRF